MPQITWAAYRVRSEVVWSISLRQSLSIDGEASVKTIIVFRNDDPSACSDVGHERKIARLFDKYRIRQTLGVVPLHCDGNPKDLKPQRSVRLDENPRMVEFLREYVARSGSEIALHGCTHQANRFSIRSRRQYSEFEGLALDEQEEMIARGTEVLVESIGARPRTFIPPWNRLDRSTILACSRQGYAIVSSGPYAPVVDGTVSLGMNCTLDTFAALFEQTASSGNGEQLLFVINYHSGRIKTQNDFVLLEGALGLAASSPDAEVLTLSETVHRYPDLARKSNEAAINVVPQCQVSDAERSRAAIYQRILHRLGIRNDLTEAYASARSLYWQGRYDEASCLSPSIDRLCGRVFRFGRLTFAAGGAVIGVSAWAGLSQCQLSSRTCGYIGILALMAILGSGSCWYSTNKDTKQEILLATVLGVIAAIGSVVLGEVISFVYLR